MNAPQISMAFPLAWPAGRPRTAERKPALFRDDGKRISFARARSRLFAQCDAMTQRGQNYRVVDMELSLNIRFTASGVRDRSRSDREPDDVGVAFYFNLDRRPHVLACDRWDTVADNVAAIAAHIEALRGQERWGVADLAQAFAGHLALAAPDPWWEVLGVTRNASLEEISCAWRTLAKTEHPNAGGKRAAWDRINDAYEAGKAERR